jgi:hypothetical protein
VKVTAFLVLQGDGLLYSHVLSFSQHYSKDRSLVPSIAQVDQTLIGQNSRTPSYESLDHLEGSVNDVTVQLYICVAFFRPFQPRNTKQSINNQFVSG